MIDQTRRPAVGFDNYLFTHDILGTYHALKQEGIIIRIVRSKQPSSINQNNHPSLHPPITNDTTTHLSKNISSTRPALQKIERFSPLITATVFLLPLLAAELVGYYFGLAWAVTVLVLVIWGDIILRLAGINFKGRRKKDKVMAPRVDKSFSCHTPDAHLGWTLLPNQSTRNSFSIPRKKLVHEYTVTTDAQGRRITAASTDAGKPTIAVYGCSNTFGWGLDDQDTYLWQLQADHTEHTFLNYGVSGYSLYQMFLTMERTIERDKPAVVVLGFSPGLEARSVSDHHYLRILSEQGGTPPSCLSTEGKNGKRSLKRFPLEAYRHLPLSDSSPLIKLVERWLNRIMLEGRTKNNARRKTTEHLLLAMENLCKKNGATFHVQYLVANTGYREFLHKAGMNWAPGPVDLDECDAVGTYTYRLSPFDGHPNTKANQAYAQAMKPILHELLEKGTYTPDPGAFGTTKRDESTESAIYPIF